MQLSNTLEVLEQLKADDLAAQRNDEVNLKSKSVAAGLQGLAGVALEAEAAALAGQGCSPGGRGLAGCSRGELARYLALLPACLRWCLGACLSLYIYIHIFDNKYMRRLRDLEECR